MLIKDLIKLVKKNLNDCQLWISAIDEVIASIYELRDLVARSVMAENLTGIYVRI